MGMDLGLGFERRKGTWLALDSTYFCLSAWYLHGCLIEGGPLSLYLRILLFDFAA